MNLPQIPYYKIIELINSGGTAAVYKAIDLRSGFMVAIKALFPSRAKDEFINQRFREEANHYLYLHHPNITKLVDFIEYQGKYYIAMEYVNGVPLNVYLNTVTGPLADERLKPLFVKILETVTYLHQNNILHLDIKPSNIMVLEDSSIKMLDMGISAKINDKSSNIKKCGSPAFMSPEQIKSQKIGRYTDIFALGITLFNMVTGKLPFTGTTHTEIFNKILSEDLPLITNFYPSANPSFQRIIEKSTAKNPIDRYQTCEELEMDIINSI